MTAIDRASALLKTGDRVGAQKILLTYLKDNPYSVEAILLLAKTTDDEKQKRLCYERALAKDPANLEAREGLERVSVVVSPPTPQPTVIEHKSESPVGPVVSIEQPESQPPEVRKSSDTSQLKRCPYCAEVIQESAIICRYCGKDLTIKQDIRQSPTMSLPRQPAKEKSGMSNVWKVLIWLNIAGFVCFLIFIFFVLVGIYKG